MISICVTVKNRSRVPARERILSLFPNCVRSIVQSAASVSSCELVVSDWHSEDWPLQEWLPAAAHPLPLRLLQVDGNFCRGRGRNLAAQAAQGEKLLFLDADSLLCPRVLQAGLDVLRQGKAYFPVLFSYNDPDHQTGYWRHFGYGNCLLHRTVFDQTGGWPEYQSWGKEDTDFYLRVGARAEVAREEVPGFFHQWHPEDLLWKEQHTERAPFLAEELSLIQAANTELEQVIPAGHTAILVDETRFGEAIPANRTILPFLEKGGQYWGAPEDDATAIRELERLRSAGAAFIAFTWITFWWLDHYPEFHQHLRSHFPAILQNPRLLVFDLRRAP